MLGLADRVSPTFWLAGEDTSEGDTVIGDLNRYTY
jgi:hypothetical protein